MRRALVLNLLFVVTLVTTGGESGCTPTDPNTGPGDPLSVSVTADENPIATGDKAWVHAVVEGGTPPYTYQWYAAEIDWIQWELVDVADIDISQALDTTYEVTVTDSSSPTRTATGEITVTVTIDPFQAFAWATKPVVEPGKSTALLSYFRGGVRWPDDYHAEWETPTDVIEYLNTNVFPTETTTYTFRVSDNNEPPSQIARTVTVTVADGVDDTPEVTIVTNYGTIVIELDRTTSPIAVNNFLRYVADGFYDGDDANGATIFHKVVADQAVWAGAYTTDMTAKTTRDGVFNESTGFYAPSNTRGTIALVPGPTIFNGPTSEFVINLADNADSTDIFDGAPSLLGFAVFGTVTEGLDVVEAIANVDVDQSDAPITPVTITSVTATSAF